MGFLMHHVYFLPANCQCVSPKEMQSTNPKVINSGLSLFFLHAKSDLLAVTCSNITYYDDTADGKHIASFTLTLCCRYQLTFAIIR